MAIWDQLTKALGGVDNIEQVWACAVRIRVTVRKPMLVDEAAIRATSALGVVRSGPYVQIVFKTGADEIAAKMGATDIQIDDLLV